MKKLLITLGLVLVAGVSPALSGCNQEGHYQLVARGIDMYKLDTVTGQVWKYDGTMEEFIPVQTFNSSSEAIQPAQSRASVKQ
jgi:hypothetical protein